MDSGQISALTDSLVNAIGDHAVPRSYDWWVLGVGLAGATIAAVSTFYAVRLYKGQMKIIKEQNAISEQQNDIALFDKKYELLKEIQDIKNNMDRTERFYIKEAIFEKRKESILKSMKDNGENPIFLLENEFKSREINSFVSIFAANVLIHRISREYIEFRRKNEKENDGTSVSDVIFFLDNINIEVDAFSDRIRKIDFVYNLSVSDKFELYRLGKIIRVIKLFRDKNDISPQGINKLKRVLNLFCTHIKNMKIMNTMNKELMEMKNKVKKDSKIDNKLENKKNNLISFFVYKIKSFSLKMLTITLSKAFNFSFRKPFNVSRSEDDITISLRNPFVMNKYYKK